ncbi:MAG TPA: ABC transporter permease [Ktedonobacterales bacterium]|jgi:peptide/nickel transport system permease protein
MARPIQIDEAPVIATQADEARDPRFRSLWRGFRRDPRWWFGVVLLLFTLAAIFAPQVSPYDPLTYHPTIVEQPPSWSHLLGTDALGRDQLSRVIYGARISLSIGVISILMGGLAGVLLGMLAAYFKGWVDQLITAVVDALLAFPSLILALAILASLGPGLVNVAVALAIVRIPIYARLARGQTLQVAAQDYVAAARSTGTKTTRILRRHVLPNIFSPLLVQATLSISFAILDESVLSFLGLGSQPPTPEWGSMITAAQSFLFSDPWMMLGPALAIVLVLLSLNIVGDALRDRLDPRDAKRLAMPLRKS